MNLRSLKVFVLVMEEGALARAAARMNLSQSAASRLLHLLEQEFDIRLFSRDSKRLTPTDEAERFFPEALRILSQIEDLPNFVDQIKSTHPKPFRVIAQTRIANGLVIPAIDRFSKALPNQPVKLEIHPRRDLGRRIMNDRYDIGVSALPLPIEKLRPRTLGAAPLKIAVARDSPLARRRLLKPDDVADMPYIALDESTVIRQIVDRNLAHSGDTLRPAHEVSLGSAAYRLVHRGMGFTFADPLALDPELEDGVALIDWAPQMEIEFGYFLPEQASDDELVAVFSDALSAVFAERRA